MSRRFQIPRWHELSVVTLVVTALVMLTTVVLAIFAVINYESERKALWADLRVQARSEADQLAEALMLPVWNFDRPQIERVVESIMQDQIVAGVVLQEEDGRRTKTTWVRGDDGKIKQIEGEFRDLGYLQEYRAVRTTTDTDLANVRLYATTKFLNRDLHHSLAKTIGLILVVDLVLTVGLYWLLRCWVFAPLRVVEAFARAVSSGGAADSVVAGKKFKGELESLRRSLQTTFSELEVRLREKNRAQAALRREVVFDELVTRLMGRFVSATAAEIDAQVIDSVREIVTFIGVECGIVVQSCRAARRGRSRTVGSHPGSRIRSSTSGICRWEVRSGSSNGSSRTSRWSFPPSGISPWMRSKSTSVGSGLDSRRYWVFRCGRAAVTSAGRSRLFRLEVR